MQKLHVQFSGPWGTVAISLCCWGRWARSQDALLLQKGRRGGWIPAPSICHLGASGNGIGVVETFWVVFLFSFFFSSSCFLLNRKDLWRTNKRVSELFQLAEAACFFLDISTLLLPRQILKPCLKSVMCIAHNNNINCQGPVLWWS